jgi:hypothetical protein
MKVRFTGKINQKEKETGNSKYYPSLKTIVTPTSFNKRKESKELVIYSVL